MVKHYLFIESHGAFDAADTPHFFALACALAAQGDRVEIMLVQNGVMAARNGARTEGLPGALQMGIPVMADDFALNERALPREALAKGVTPAALATVIERMAGGWNVVWH